MLGLITTKATITKQPVDSQIHLTPSTQYLINCSNIVKMEVTNTDDSLIRYKLNKNQDRSREFEFIANETNAQIQVLADVDAKSLLVDLPVFVDAASFSNCDSTPVTKFFTIESISWVEENATSTICKIWVEEGGWGLRSYYVNYGIAQVADMLATGTTSTTTTSTTSTTSSTSSTSTSSTSTSSTSSTSTSTTSTTTTH